MNRTQAKARAAELGISKEEARAFGNLSKTQTWLDAITAHEAAFQSVIEAGEYSDAESTEETDVLGIGGEQHPAVDVLEETNPAAESSAPVALSELTDEEETFPAELQPSLIVAEASVPMFPDPWGEPEAPVEAAMTRGSSEPIAPLDDEATPASVSRPVPAKQNSEPAKASPDASALVYPLLLLGIVVWAAYQLLAGLGSLMSLGLHHVAKQSIPATRVRLEEKTPVHQPAAQSSWPLSRATQQARLQPDG